MNWSRLKSGTDIRGTAVNTETGKMVLTDEVVERIAAAFALWLSEKTGVQYLRVAVGRDSRISGERMRAAVVRALTAGGAEVYDCGLASTPAMFMATRLDIRCDAAIEITASHHPFDKNGLKFFTREGGLEGGDIQQILKLAEKGTAPAPGQGTVRSYDFMAVYAAHLRTLICKESGAGEKPLAGLHIVVDAGNGVGGFYAWDVLEPLGADCSGSQFLEPDGMFPNHVPNPEDAEAIASVQEAAVRAGADLGIIFDTDVDRMGCVSSDGREINRNRLIALASVIALEHCPGGTIVTDSLTSNGLRAFIEGELGARQLRYRRGYKNVINKALELNRSGTPAPLAIETSGHAALQENYFLDDGAYLATKIVVKLAQMKRAGRPLADLIADLEEPGAACEIRFPILAEPFRPYGESVLEQLEAYSRTVDGWAIAPENYEGVRINFDGGWLLLRMSVHDPIMPLNVECADKNTMRPVLGKLDGFFRRMERLDCAALDAALNHK